MGDLKILVHDNDTDINIIPKTIKALPKYENQASGHSQMFVVDAGKKILKPCNPQENKVYIELQSVKSLVPFIPKYFGEFCETSVTCGIARYSQIPGKYIILENLTEPFEAPCVMDLKMGIKDEGSPDTNLQLISQVKTSALHIDKIPKRTEVGFRFSGLSINYGNTRRVFSPEELGILTFHDAFEIYLNSNYLLLFRFIEKLELLHQTLQNQTVEFRGGSILLIYDGISSENQERSKMDVRVIDYDKAELNSVPDSFGVISGIANIINKMRQFLKCKYM